MKTVQLTEEVVEASGSELFGPDPVLLKKQGLVQVEPKDIAVFKKKILDSSYLDYAIDRIAMELSHFIAK